MDSDEAAHTILPCCGSKQWAATLANSRPIADESALLRRADQIWWLLDEADWLEAFATHPRIGDCNVQETASHQSAGWSATEQLGVTGEDQAVLSALAEANRRYERRFGRTYIVCATGKSAREMLDILERRLANDDRTEFREAAEQQRQITALRLNKWLNK